MNHFWTLGWVQLRSYRHKITNLRQKRFGKMTNAIMYAILALVVLGATAGGFAAGISVGDSIQKLLSKGKPPSGLAVMFVADGVLAFFLFFWLIDLIEELKRDEPISFKRMLYLPITLRTVFLLNFCLSIVSPLFVLFTLPLITFSIGASIQLGPKMLLTIPLGFMFYIMLAAWTYYLQGIFTFFMQNKRRRRIALMIIPFVFVVPSIALNSVFIGGIDDAASSITESDQAEKTEDGDTKVNSMVRGQSLGVESKEAKKEARNAYVNYIATTGNSLLPFGWFPLGLAMIIENRFLVVLQCFVSLSLLAGFGIFFGYRSTLRFHTQPASSGKRSTRGNNSIRRRPLGQKAIALRLPLMGELMSGIIMRAFVANFRHPMVWMMLFAPAFMGFFLLLALVNLRNADSILVTGMMSSVAPTAAIMLPFFGTASLFNNMFGLDIGGFRSYVLLPVPRWRYIFGNNVLIFAGSGFLSILMYSMTAFFIQYTATAVITAMLQILQLGFALCIIGNMVSIYFPFYVDLSGTKPSFKTQMTMMLVGLILLATIGVLFVPAAIGMAIDSVLLLFYGYEGFSIGILFSLITVAVTALAYTITLPKYGALLQQREIIILNKLMKMKT